MPAIKDSKNVARRRTELWIEDDRVPPKATIETLPDVVLLDIFDFFVGEACKNEWHTLVHVRRRWRHIVFASPRRLNLQLHCTSRSPVKKTVGIWPVFPIKIHASGRRMSRINGTDNVFAALRHRDRVCYIDIWGLASSLLEGLAAVMQEPLPSLTCLRLSSSHKLAPILPDSFLGGAAPRLRSLNLKGIPFPALPQLLLSAPGLVTLHLIIPHSGYFSPEAMVTGLSVLTRLEHLDLEFLSSRSQPNRASRSPPLQTRIVILALRRLNFKGVNEYLEGLVAQISAPLLRNVYITLFNQLAFDVSQFSQFIGRAEKLNAFNQAGVVFYHLSVGIRLHPQIQTADDTTLQFRISCRELDWQLSSLAQVCGSFSTPLSTLERLDIRPGQHWQALGQEDMENNQWLELLHPFTSVKNLYLSQNLTMRIAPALQELAADRGRVTDVLPALQNLFLKEPQSGPVQDAVKQFVAARRLSGRPVFDHHWKRGMWDSDVDTTGVDD